MQRQPTLGSRQRSKRQAEARKKASAEHGTHFPFDASLTLQASADDPKADQAIAAVAAGSDDSARALIREARAPL